MEVIIDSFSVERGGLSTKKYLVDLGYIRAAPAARTGIDPCNLSLASSGLYHGRQGILVPLKTKLDVR